MRARRTLATTLARVSRRGLHGGPFGAAGAAGAVDVPPTEFFESIRALGGEHERFAEWLHARVSADETSRGGRNVHPAVTAARVPGMGVGLVARRPVRAGETVLRIPRDAYEPLSAPHALAAAKEAIVAAEAPWPSGGGRRPTAIAVFSFLSSLF